MAGGFGVDFVVVLSRREEAAYEVALADLGSKVEKCLDVLVEICSSAIRDVVSDVGHRTRHVRQGTFDTFDVACLNREFTDEGDLEIVEVLIQTRQFPVTAIFHFAFNNEPEDVVSEAVTGNSGAYGGF